MKSIFVHKHEVDEKQVVRSVKGAQRAKLLYLHAKIGNLQGRPLVILRGTK